MTDVKKEITERLKKEIEARLEKMKQELFALVDSKKVKEEWPKVGDKVYLLYSDGSMTLCKWDGDEVDTAFLKRGNAFRTKEEAERIRDLRIKKREVIKEMRRISGNFKPDWCNFKQKKYCLACGHQTKSWMIKLFRTNQYSNLPAFPTQEKAQEAIDTLGDLLNVLLEEDV